MKAIKSKILMILLVFLMSTQAGLMYASTLLVPNLG